MTNSWRALAKMARDRITSTNPEDLPLILSVSLVSSNACSHISYSSTIQLWYLRLACLSRLRLFNQTSAECTNLFSVLSSIEPPSTRTYVFDRLVPFELEVMHARLKYWAGDHMSYLDALSALLRKCRTKARLAKSDNSIVAMWKERGSRICLIIASQLMEMKASFPPIHPHPLPTYFTGLHGCGKVTRASLRTKIWCNLSCPPILNSKDISSGRSHRKGLKTLCRSLCRPNR
jgi:hypothetical protein